MKRKIKILRNRARCKVCGETIESKSTHDFVPCKCFRESNGTEGIFVDGGTSYLRQGGSRDIFEDLSETRLYTEEEKEEYNERQLLLAEQYGGWFTVDLME